MFHCNCKGEVKVEVEDCYSLCIFGYFGWVRRQDWSTEIGCLEKILWQKFTRCLVKQINLIWKPTYFVSTVFSGHSTQNPYAYLNKNSTTLITYRSRKSHKTGKKKPYKELSFIFPPIPLIHHWEVEFSKHKDHHTCVGHFVETT